VSGARRLAPEQPRHPHRFPGAGACVASGVPIAGCCPRGHRREPVASGPRNASAREILREGKSATSPQHPSAAAMDADGLLVLPIQARSSGGGVPQFSATATRRCCLPSWIGSHGRGPEFVFGLLITLVLPKHRGAVVLDGPDLDLRRRPASPAALCTVPA
jgi:hypothetical protein